MAILIPADNRWGEIGGLIGSYLAHQGAQKREREGMNQLLAAYNAKEQGIQKQQQEQSAAIDNTYIGNVPSLDDGMTAILGDDNAGEQKAVAQQSQQARNQYTTQKRNAEINPQKLSAADILSIATTGAKAGMSPDQAYKLAGTMAGDFNAKQDQARQAYLLNGFLTKYQGSPDYNSRNNALVEYMALTGNTKELPDIYKAGIGDYAIKEDDLGDRVVQTMYDKKGGPYGKVSMQQFGKGIDPTNKYTADMGYKGRIDTANINGQYGLLRKQTPSAGSSGKSGKGSGSNSEEKYYTGPSTNPKDVDTAKTMLASIASMNDAGEIRENLEAYENFFKKALGTEAAENHIAYILMESERRGLPNSYVSSTSGDGWQAKNR
ncbi:hypothetical protein EV210_101142 [Anaerospora hongkongensis]|uniref:Uncharacterized protein n=1 Tax=Anaerospora hongkongensis TaxID=244830 RepID=A0A4R1Q4E3_9FIRM|nr:hypothetical protein [Anaerospora hongkongensis]TCL39944.1 hypothetical protein EV210_101142 [Anaerospora hongkongensis]